MATGQKKEEEKKNIFLMKQFKTETVNKKKLMQDFDSMRWDAHVCI